MLKNWLHLFHIQNTSAVLYFGFVGSNTVTILYPSSLLDHLLELGYDLDLTVCSLTFDNTQLYIVREWRFDETIATLILLQTINSVRIRLPLPVLLNQESHRGAIIFSHPHEHRLLATRIRNLTTGLDECPYQDVHIVAPVCGQITRTTYYVQRVGLLRWTTDQVSATTNCSIMETRVPKQIFLKKWDSYQLEVDFEISEAFPGMLQLTQL